MGLLTLGYLIVGFLLVAVGAELLIKGAVRLAARLRIPPLVIGLTVVAIGSSSPEMAVGIEALVKGSSDLSIGNVIGSNIANILLILGLCALIAPLAVSRRLIRLDLPAMLAAGLLFYALAFDGLLTRTDGLLLLVALLLYIGLVVRAAREPQAPANEACSPAYGNCGPSRSGALRNLVLITSGIGVLTGGAHLLVVGAQTLALALGLSQLVIGLTVIAVGTSLPELATSLLAAVRGQRHLAVGTVLGSCLYNLLLVPGSTALLAPNTLSVSPNALAFDLPVMLAAFFACLPILLSGYRVSRWQGLLLLAYYLVYTLYLALFAAGLPSLALLRQAIGWFALPLTIAVLLFMFYRSRKRGDVS